MVHINMPFMLESVTKGFEERRRAEADVTPLAPPPVTEKQTKKKTAAASASESDVTNYSNSDTSPSRSAYG
jgi:hypothetical protein